MTIIVDYDQPVDCLYMRYEDKQAYSSEDKDDIGIIFSWDKKEELIGFIILDASYKTYNDLKSSKVPDDFIFEFLKWKSFIIPPVF